MKTILLAIASLAFDPHGVITASNGKAIIGFEFKAGERKNLTADLGEFNIKDFAVSENGKTLAIWDGKNFKVRILPFGKFSDIPLSAMYVKKGYQFGSRRFQSDQCGPVGDDVKSLNMSPDGKGISFELTSKNIAWKLVARNNAQANQAWIQHRQNALAAHGGVDDESNAGWPLYIAQYDIFNGIYPLKLNQGVYEGKYYVDDCLGNVAEYVPAESYRQMDPYGICHTANQGVLFPSIKGYGSRTTPFYGPGTHVSIQQSIEKLSIKRSVLMGAWSKNPQGPHGQMFAAVLERPNGMYPVIEIRDNTKPYMPKKTFMPAKGMYSGVYEIPVTLQAENQPGRYEKNSRNLLAWRNDDALTLLFKGKLYVYPQKAIYQLIENSGVEKSVFFNGITEIVAVRNNAEIKPELFAEGINATRLIWVSDSAFIFRDEDGALYGWENGETKKLMRFLPEKFDYSVSLPEIKTQTPAAQEQPAEKPANKKNPAIEMLSGKEQAPCSNLNNSGGKSNTFQVGPIKMMWSGCDQTLGYKASNVSIWLASKLESDMKESVSYAIVNESLGEINSPPARDSINLHSANPLKNIRLNVKNTLIAYRGNDVVAIQPIKFLDSPGWAEEKKKMADMAEKRAPKKTKMMKTKMKPENEPANVDLMEYEWKFWPNAGQSSRQAPN